jgi:hypothetical protein
MVQCRSRLGLALKARKRLRVAGHLIWKKLEGDEPVKPDVLGLVDDAHAAATQLLHDSVVRDSPANKEAAALVRLFVFDLSKHPRNYLHSWTFEEAFCFVVSGQQ